MSTPVSLQKCLESILDRSQAKRYLRNAGKTSLPARTYYNNALRDLSKKDSEGAIHNLIIALDTERDNEPSLHLVKTMLFGLSKKFHEAGGEDYKRKYVTLANWINIIEKEIVEVDKVILSLKNEKLQNQKKGLWFLLQKTFFKNSIKNYDAIIQKHLNKKEELKDQLSFAAKLSQIGEYAKVLSTILEICLYPARYSWVVA
ncbi:MAG: hypothetical protein U0457_13600 [Candidatus Sericytochromatia bacterium]